jgi:hypothetical protein
LVVLLLLLRHRTIFFLVDTRGALEEYGFARAQGA